MNTKRLLVAAFLSVSIPAFATDEKTVMLMTDSPDFIEQINSKKGEGTISWAYISLFGQLGLSEPLRLTPFNRQAVMLDQNDIPACALYRFKSKERELKYVFSQPIYFLLHFRLYQQATADNLPKTVFDTNGDVISLQALLDSSPSAKLLYIPDFSYGDILNPQLSNLPDKSKVTVLGAVARNKVSELFLANRAEFALMFPGEVHRYMGDNAQASYKSYNIAGVPHVTKGYMMCNKTSASFAYIEKVNKAISDLYTTPEYLFAHTSPYNASEIPGIKKALAQLIATYE